ncbi:von Willebrand factor A domain-containing protein 3A isoform X2 [Rhinichthys klamathensis goyatoka]|uniref:von Willebrand factor A domain-containing protein 3A isoform X2 n=1 Tax=Rhinichthys klamathensis goyatoka TaxID=3034132 RepID=UPI0024B5816F|nr:von Willebrand factor A domain-containing protein 3A isoform X2 [Rhinichthys klamathensis goyatoka]
MEQKKTGPLEWAESSESHMETSDQSTIFRLNQTSDDRSEVYASSERWLEDCGLTVSRPFSLCNTRPVSERGDVLSKQMHVSSESLADFEEQLYIAIEMYHDRIKWLSQGNRKVFGVVNGSRVGVLVDTSDFNASTERLGDLQRELLTLIEEQLCFKNQLYLLSYSSEVSSLWDKPLDISPLRLRECYAWVMQLRASGGCDLLQAIQRALTHSQLDTLLIIQGDRPDQMVEVICDCLAVKPTPCVHAVAYNCSSPATIETVKRMADVSGGRYHLFSAALGVVDSSTDVDLLWEEIKAARDVLTQIQDMRQGRVGHTAVESEISRGLDSLTVSESSPVSCALAGPLRIKPAGRASSSSRDWLKTHGLKAQKLDLYQLLARDAYSQQETFVPILGKTVSSTVHERVMVQCDWHDGTVKNLHVDLPSLQKYQKRLMGAVCLFERRVEWLNGTASRQIWGTVCEQRVQVVLDMSGMNTHYQLHIQYALRILLEEQLADTHSFNVTVFGSDVKSWQEKMVPSTRENLQAVWQWVQALECVGGRDTLAALRRALEEEPQEEEEASLTRGVYLFTTGTPDQHSESVTDYVSERCIVSNLKLHVCLFTGEEESVRCPAPRHATRALSRLAHAGHGRFLWTTETGIVESDDISALIGEMETAADYCQKCSELLDSLIQKGSGRGSGEANSSSLKPQAWTRNAKLPCPRPTTLSLARLEGRQMSRSAQNGSAWRANSSKAEIPAVQSADFSTPAGPSKSADQRRTIVSQSVFFMEDGNFGVVFKKYPKPKSVRKSINTIKLPKHEDICSTKQWLKRFGIKNLKLDLHKLISGPECCHHNKLVRSVQKRVSAKYCGIFPSVLLNGAVKHLHLTPGELKHYLSQTEKLMQRYSRRLEWLLTGSRRMFGSVLEKDVCVLLDVSGSMASFLPELQKGLTTLIWDQLHANSVRFTMLAFSEGVCVWQPAPVESSEDQCVEAVQWLSRLTPHGPSHTLQALQDPVLPTFEGDDLRKLSEEIEKLRLFQKQAKSFRETILGSRNLEGT